MRDECLCVVYEKKVEEKKREGAKSGTEQSFNRSSSCCCLKPHYIQSTAVGRTGSSSSWKGCKLRLCGSQGVLVGGNFNTEKEPDKRKERRRRTKRRCDALFSTSSTSITWHTYTLHVRVCMYVCFSLLSVCPYFYSLYTRFNAAAPHSLRKHSLSFWEKRETLTHTNPLYSPWGCEVLVLEKLKERSQRHLSFFSP